MKEIPIIINNFNRLSTTEKLVDSLNLLGYYNIFILDMSSTYKPLLEWYSNKKNIQVIYLENKGHKVLWETHLLKMFSSFSWIVYTDSDIELNIDTPTDFIETLIDIAEEFKVNKVGLALEYKNISLDYRDIIYPIESSYWLNKLVYKDLELYNAPIDTTFSIVKPKENFTYNAIRVAGNFTSKHIPWYEDFNNLSIEEKYYMDNANEKVSTSKQHYLKWLN